jgi:acetyl-CoA acetyltransferase
MAVGSGLYEPAMAFGVEKLNGRGSAPLSRMGDTLEIITGFSPPGMWAMRTQRYMAQYGTSLEQLAKEAVKNQKHGKLNPRAHYPQEVTVEEVRKSPMICYPLTLLDSCPTTDGERSLSPAARRSQNDIRANLFILRLRL